ncbi:TcaA second domain-containing protein [Bacillus sp. Hm123]|uniref:TcaA second domain-containing protein n=1 Tax=Bacillus sp. Hm123 TaxID=3450745 RepID=UPI003F43F8DB
MTKNKLLTLIAMLVAVLLVGVYVAMQQVVKPEKTVEKFTEAVSKEDPKLLKKLVITDNKKAAVNDTSMKAMIDYLKKNNSSFDAIKEGLKQQVEDEDYVAQSQQISLIEDGKKWGLFPNYKLKVNTVMLKVTGQNKDDQLALTINQLKKPLYKEDEALYGPVIPGVYEMKVKVSNAMGSFFDEQKVDAWGNKEVSIITDSVQLARDDEKVQKDILSAIDVFNNDVASFQASGFNIEKLTNATDDIKNDPTMKADKAIFEETKNYIAELQFKYLGAIVNLDQVSLSYFDGQWKAQVNALVDYHSKLTLKESGESKEEQTKSIGQYLLVYNTEKKQWLIEGLQSKPAMGTEADSWKNKLDMKVKSPQVHTWSQSNEGNYF